MENLLFSAFSVISLLFKVKYNEVYNSAGCRAIFYQLALITYMTILFATTMVYYIGISQDYRFVYPEFVVILSHNVVHGVTILYFIEVFDLLNETKRAVEGTNPLLKCEKSSDNII